MTDIEFAKAVAENVWKYIRSWDEQDQRYMWFSEEDSFEDRNIIEEVNSWEGFGRTVEAMTNMEFLSRGDVQRCHSASDNYFCKRSTKEEYWKSIHQAALDAVKEKQ